MSQFQLYLIIKLFYFIINYLHLIFFFFFLIVPPPPKFSPLPHPAPFPIPGGGARPALHGARPTRALPQLSGEAPLGDAPARAVRPALLRLQRLQRAPGQCPPLLRALA